MLIVSSQLMLPFNTYFNIKSTAMHNKSLWHKIYYKFHNAATQAFWFAWQNTGPSHNSCYSLYSGSFGSWTHFPFTPFCLGFQVCIKSLLPFCSWKHKTFWVSASALGPRSWSLKGLATISYSFCNCLLFCHYRKFLELQFFKFTKATHIWVLCTEMPTRLKCCQWMSLA